MTHWPILPPCWQFGLQPEEAEALLQVTLTTGCEVMSRAALLAEISRAAEESAHPQVYRTLGRRVAYMTPWHVGVLWGWMQGYSEANFEHALAQSQKAAPPPPARLDRAPVKGRRK